MKYYEGFSNRKKHFGFGFYSVIAACLLLIGGASWFALSGLEKANTKIESQKPISSEYNNNTSSYTESVAEESVIPTPNTDVKNEVTSEIYNSTPKEETPPKESISFSLPVQGEIIKDYSLNGLQYSATYNDMRLHPAVDIACEIDSPVFAAGNGTVANIESNTSNGNIVTIEHVGNITIKYASLKNINVKIGDTVKMGDIIGYVDTIPSECNDKSHIHIEAFKSGKITSPLKALGLE